MRVDGGTRGERIDAARKPIFVDVDQEIEIEPPRRLVAEMQVATVSERQGRLIDTDEAASMEKKKREGYF